MSTLFSFQLSAGWFQLQCLLFYQQFSVRLNKMQAINTSSLSKNFTILINADLGCMRDEPSNMYVSKTTNQLGPKKKKIFFFYSRIRLALALSVITSEKEKSTVNLLVPFAGPAKQLENPILSSKVDPLYPPIISSRTPLSYISSHYYA